ADRVTGAADLRIRDAEDDAADVRAGKRVHAGEAAQQVIGHCVRSVCACGVARGADRCRPGEQARLQVLEANEVEVERVIAWAGEGLPAAEEPGRLEAVTICRGGADGDGRAAPDMAIRRRAGSALDDVLLVRRAVAPGPEPRE